MRQVTLCIVLADKKILLAMKKRGFGAGKWNGMGGKVGKGETLRQAAVRELKEEVCIDAHEDDLEEVAVLDFHFDHDPSLDQTMHAFIVRAWKGEPQETEEMAPQWYMIEDIPYGSMWIDDILWLPRVLRGEKLKGTFYFTKEGSEVERHTLTEWRP